MHGRAPSRSRYLRSRVVATRIVLVNEASTSGAFSVPELSRDRAARRAVPLHAAGSCRTTPAGAASMAAAMLATVMRLSRKVHGSRRSRDQSRVDRGRRRRTTSRATGLSSAVVLYASSRRDRRTAVAIGLSLRFARLSFGHNCTAAAAHIEELSLIRTSQQRNAQTASQFRQSSSARCCRRRRRSIPTGPSRCRRRSRKSTASGAPPRAAAPSKHTRSIIRTPPATSSPTSRTRSSAS
jgi:hypothetical protein